MKANELRIGNIVLRKEFLHSNLENCRFDKIVVTHNDINACHIYNRHFEPIPLTEEWLLKFGFEKTMSWTYAKNLVGNLKLVYYLGEKGWSIGFKPYSDFPNLKYVHQLQNLYFALTGEELTYGGNNEN
jgi:hypothetical protein